jgi:sec-independent protein translocase protein TatA
LQTHWELCHGIDSHTSAHARNLCLPVWRRTNLRIRQRDDADATTDKPSEHLRKMTTQTLAFFAGGLGMPEMFLILTVVLILFGAKKLPELAKGMGQGIKEFKRATHDVQEDLERAMDDKDKSTTHDG